jgi:hypothetical protein
MWEKNEIDSWANFFIRNSNWKFNQEKKKSFSSVKDARTEFAIDTEKY